jgi:hypothetical protein
LRAFIDAAHARGLGVVMELAYNHTSPDSLLAASHPEWFWMGDDGKPAPRVAEWSDAIDLDYSMRRYSISTADPEGCATRERRRPREGTCSPARGPSFATARRFP